MNLKLKEGKSIAEHLSEFQDLVNQMVTMKLVINDELQALLLLSSLLIAGAAQQIWRPKAI